jgi:hypothetical protein
MESNPLLVSFDSIKFVEEFYMSYAHKVGFSVRISVQHLVVDEVARRRSYAQGKVLRRQMFLQLENKRTKQRQDVDVVRMYL